jgi:hypothetical protein
MRMVGHGIGCEIDTTPANGGSLDVMARRSTVAAIV